MKTSSGHKIIISPRKDYRHYWREIWQYRELFYFLSWKDILVRYKQTVIGISWAILRPLITILIFSVVFGKLAKLPSEGVPYPILVFVAMLPWQLFATSLTDSSNSLIQNVSLIAKIYFPRVMIPISTIMVCVIDFLISLILLIGLMILYKCLPDWRVIVVPLLLLLTVLASLGAGLWISALNVKYRDFRYIVPFIVQIGLYVSPVGFSSSIIPEKWRLLYSLNPMVGVVDGFRWAFLQGKTDLYLPGLIISVCLVVSIFVTGFLYFRKVERTFADVI